MGWRRPSVSARGSRAGELANRIHGAGAYSRRINIKHRLVYQVLKDARTVKVLHMWTHYE